MKTKLKSWLVIALVFIVGFGAGVVVTRGVVRHAIRQAATNPDRVRDIIERRLTRQLDLDASQRKQVHDILVDSHSELRTLRGEYRPQFMAIVSNAEQRVATLLNEKQRERFAKVCAENRQFWEPRVNP
jgi:uncharacterized membrane-anchored protein YhcB (DUF1043 family)